jgi:hypothetical protein
VVGLNEISKHVEPDALGEVVSNPSSSERLLLKMTGCEIPQRESNSLDRCRQDPSKMQCHVSLGLPKCLSTAKLTDSKNHHVQRSKGKLSGVQPTSAFGY